MTTSYHPQANGLVERLHRHLKAALRCHGEAWYDALSTVLLGLRTAWKEDIQTTPAELTYGECIRVPGEFLASSNDRITAPSLVKRLRAHFRNVAPVPISRHGTRATFVFKDLSTCTRVFVRTDSLHMAYGSPYTGPYRVVSRNDKYFVIWFRSGGLGNYKNTPISIDRLKSAYILPEDLQQLPEQQPPTEQRQDELRDEPTPSTSARTTAPPTSTSKRPKR
ncbi:uncharacterized protein LOC107044260, partial [Diachasma alloeum]|uniref:uncharacterized protein LOC107044260 n=1 Tax=Diachasma alloeum TaxID=454923 RepID=UPI0007382CE4